MRQDGAALLDNFGGALRIIWAVATPFLRPRRLRWGATDEEVRRSYPGDDIVPHPRWQSLHAISVATSASQIWPWVAQIGQGRGGFYSYQLLENLVGCRIENTDRILEEHQQVAPGDEVRLHPQVPPLAVSRLVPGHALVLHARDDLRGGEPSDPNGTQPECFVNLSWAFVIEDGERGGCRLYSRYRSDYGKGLGMALSYGPSIVEPISFVMGTRMLQGIKLRAELVSR